jgi:hypothetical protein
MFSRARSIFCGAGHTVPEHTKAGAFMTIHRTITAALVGLAMTAACGATAVAETVAFTAELNGAAITSKTGSKATATAKISIDTAKETVTLSLDVQGITIEGLWDRLVAAPIGPIHLHHYATHDHSTGDGVTLLLPVPYGANYVATPGGFRVRMTDYPYAEGAKLVGTDKTFAQFKAALEGGDLVLNIHTDAFNDGEISGLVVPAAQ